MKRINIFSLINRYMFLENYIPYYFMILIGISCGDITAFHLKYVSANSTDSIFGFGEFFTATSTLLVIYAISDWQVKFRVAVNHLSIKNISFYGCIIIGLLILMNEIWFTYELPIPEFLNDKASLQLIAVFLMLIILGYYTWVGFINPPIYNHKNYKRFKSEIPHIIALGNDEQLKAVATEIQYSLGNIIKYALKTKSHNEHDHNLGVNEFASHFFYVIDEPRFISLLVSSAQGTIITLLKAIKLNNAHNLYYDNLIKNIFLESLINKNSFLHRECKQYASGMTAREKPISSLLFKNLDLVISQKLFDVSYTDYQTWDNQQLKCYLRALEMFILELCKQKNMYRGLQEVYSAFKVISIYAQFQDFDKRKPINDDYLYTIMSFISDIIRNIDDIPENERPKAFNSYITKEDFHYDRTDIYACISYLIYNIIKNVAMKLSDVKYNQDYYWVAYNTIWSKLSLYHNSFTKRTVFYKLRRKLYLEIKEAEDFPNYLNMTILGFCLNLPEASNKVLDYRFLKAVRLWTTKNYFKIRNDNIDIANAAIVGRLSYDEDKNAIVTTYEKGLSKEAPKEYLYLKTDDNII